MIRPPTPPRGRRLRDLVHKWLDRNTGGPRARGRPQPGTTGETVGRSRTQYLGTPSSRAELPCRENPRRPPIPEATSSRGHDAGEPVAVGGQSSGARARPRDGRRTSRADLRSGDSGLADPAVSPSGCRPVETGDTARSDCQRRSDRAGTYPATREMSRRRPTPSAYWCRRIMRFPWLRVRRCERRKTLSCVTFRG